MTYRGLHAVVDINNGPKGTVVACLDCPWSENVPGWAALDAVSVHASQPHPPA